jgi:hypothetical protein
VTAKDDERIGDAERTAREVARRDRTVLDGLEARGERSLRDRWVLLGMDPDDDPLVRVQPASAYALPSHARKILTRSSLAELESILDVIRLANDDVDGMKTSVASVLLADDEAVLDVRRRLRAWADGYVAARLAKWSPRDGGGQVPRFRRIYGELLPALDDVAVSRETVHHAFMGELVD